MRSILVSLLVNVGDVVMMTAALHLIKRNFPQTRLAALIRPEAEELLKNNPAVDEIIIYPYRSGSFFYGLGRLRRRIADGRYDVFLSLDRRPRGVMAAFLGGIATRLGPELLYEGSRPRLGLRLLNSRTIAMSPGDLGGDQVEMFQQVARRALDLKGQGRITLPPPSAEALDKARGLLKDAKGPVIGLCVKTRDPAKTWPPEAYAALMVRLKKELKAFMYVSGGPEDRDYAQNLIESASPDIALNLAGRTSLMELAALASISDLYLGPDNGAAHLVANSGVKQMVCLLRATTPEKIIGSMPRASFIQVAEVESQATTEKEIELIFSKIVGLLAGNS